jgi:hypothetical protein
MLAVAAEGAEVPFVELVHALRKRRVVATEQGQARRRIGVLCSRSRGADTSASLRPSAAAVRSGASCSG